MKKKPTPSKSFHSKSFDEGINNLLDEIQLAFQWHRPSILLAIHPSMGGQQIAQEFLEKKLLKGRYRIQQIIPQKDHTDVIQMICTSSKDAKTVFFVSGLENANQLSGGQVYRGLNLHREHLVEQKICAVFWLTELEAANLPHFAPDFWAFRHRVIEFAPQRGPRHASVPSGMFLWKDHLPWMDLEMQKKQITRLEESLSKLTDDMARIDSTLKLVHLNWQLYNLEHFQRHFENLLNLLKGHSNFQYHGWALNVKAIKLFEEGERAAAGTCFEQALKMEPNNSRFLINAAVLAHGTGKNREAILTATRATKSDPASAEVWHILGLLHLFTGKPEQAVAALQKALANETNDLNLKCCLAICHAKNNQPEACEAQLAGIATSQNPLLSACRHILKGDMDGALSLLRRSLQDGVINSHQLLQDPNLHALVNTSTLMNLSAA